jgi:hypothetical protein
MIRTAFVALIATAGAVQAQPYDHIDSLAMKLQRQTQALHREVDMHFKNTRAYRHLHQDIEQMEQAARHIHEVAHGHGSVAHIRADVEKLDRLYHHMEEVIQDLSHDRRIDGQTIRHLRREVAGVGDTLHHLREDLSQLTPAPRPRVPAPRLPGPEIQAPGWRIEFGPRGIRVAPPRQPQLPAPGHGHGHGHDHDHDR